MVRDTMLHRQTFRFIAFAIALALYPGLVWADTEITHCGQHVEGGTAYLSADLDCSSEPPFSAIVDLYHATLDLRGFSLRGAPSQGIVCFDCRIFGPGAIHTIVSVSRSGLLENLALSSDYECVRGTTDRVRLRNVQASNCRYGISAAKVTVSDSVIEDGGSGVLAYVSLRVFRSTIRNNASFGVASEGVARIVDSTISGNHGPGIRSRFAVVPAQLQVDGSVITDNDERGIDYEVPRVRISNSEISGNGLSGLANDNYCFLHTSVSVRNSMIAGNALSPACSSGDSLCVDVDSCHKPAVIASTCDTSHASGSGVPGTNWGVCGLDGP